MHDLNDSSTLQRTDGSPVSVEDEVVEQGIEPEHLEGTADTDADIKDPFDPTAIKIDTKNITVDLIIRRIDRDEIDLNPDFQRNSGIWDRTRQSRLIESLLLRIPIPVFYMAADSRDNWQVVDGLQRLDTLKSFVLDRHLKLQRLEYLTFDYCSYDDLPRPMQRRIEETQLYCHIIQPGTPPEVMFNVFNRINTGGKPLLPQEIRHALNPGMARDFINALAKEPAFLEATNRSVSPKRMADRECALRFVAFYRSLPEYKGDLDGFLVAAMKSLSCAGDGELASLRERFGRAMKLAVVLFGNDAFRRPSQADTATRKPINKPLFESWAVNLARVTDSRLERRLTERRERVRAAFVELMSDDEFVQSISIGTQWATRVRIRFGRIEELVRRVTA